MRSKRSQEGWLEIDHRDSPGVPDELIEQARRAGKDVPVGSGRGRFERGFIVCAHCQATVLINPLRTRERNWCWTCDHYVCDQRACVERSRVDHKPFRQRLDEAQERAVRLAVDGQLVPGLRALEPQLIPNLVAASKVAAEILYDDSLKKLQKRDDVGALAAIEQAISKSPNDPRLLFQRGLCHLLAGDWAKGWDDKEEGYRMKVHAHANMPPALKWQGESGRDVILLAEDGAGDEIMMTRYLPWVEARSRTVMALCHGGIASLLQGRVQTADADRPVAQDTADQPPAWCYIGGLPRLHGTRPDNVPPPLPWLRQAALATPFPLPANEGRRKIGICWAGHPKTPHDCYRSMRLSDLKALSAIDADFYSFQLDGWPGRRIIDLGPRLTDWLRTAAALVQMDAVVSVDTAVAHLAASLGVATHMLATRYPVWQWPLDVETSPWYPSMRIHWQKTLEDWSVPVASVVEALGRRLLDMPIHVFYIDGQRCETSEVALTGAQIKAAGSISPGNMMFMEVQGGPDRGIGDGERVPVDGGHFYAVPAATMFGGGARP